MGISAVIAVAAVVSAGVAVKSNVDAKKARNEQKDLINKAKADELQAETDAQKKAAADALAARQSARAGSLLTNKSEGLGKGTTPKSLLGE